jgi:hypothetical protein
MIIKHPHVYIIMILLFTFPVYSRILNPLPQEMNIYMADDFSPQIKASSKAFAVRWQDLPQIEKIDFSNFRELDTVILKFGIAPDAKDAEKQKLIKSVESNLKYLASIRKCKSLKNFVLQVGTFTFIKSNDKYSYQKIKNLEAGNKCEKCRDMTDALNLERADNRFGKKIQGLLPGVRLYSVNWAW